MYNLSKSQSSITAKVESLIGRMDKMTDVDIKSEFISVLNDQETSVSDKTRAYWINEISKCKSKIALMFSITNLHLAGCDLRLNPKRD